MVADPVVERDPSDFLTFYHGVDVFRPHPELEQLIREARSEGMSWAGALYCELLNEGERRTRLLYEAELEQLPFLAIWRADAGERHETVTLVELADRAAADPRRFEPPNRIEPQYEQVGRGQPLAFEAVVYARGRRYGNWQRPQLYEALFHLWDYRGAPAALLDEQAWRLEPNVTFGTHLAEIVLGMIIPGPRGRRDAAMSRLTGSSPARAGHAARLGQPLVAGGVAEYLQSELPYSDGRTPPLGYTDTRWVEGREVTNAPRPGWLADAAIAGTDRRRGRVFAAALKQLEEDAFGRGINSPRGRRVLVSIDDASGEAALVADDRSLLQSLFTDEDATGSRTLVARLRHELRADERTLLDARLAAPESSFSEIALVHGWDIDDVRATWRRVRRAAGRLRQ